MKTKSIILAIVVVLVISSILFLETQKTKPDTTIVNGDNMTKNNTNLAPEFQGIKTWLNSEPLTMNKLRGKVVLVDFWTYSCINCIRTLPYINTWYEKYKDNGLVIIGVHAPEFQFEKKVENVQNAVDKYNIKYSVALDNNHQTWSAYQNRYWPRKYLIDKNGIIRYDHIGEGGYKETEKVIQKLLREIDSNVETSTVKLEDNTPNTKNTPELYAGYKFANSRNQKVSGEVIDPQSTKEYVIPTNPARDEINLQGTWTASEDGLVAQTNGTILLLYKAKAVNIVAEIASNITVTHDGVKREVQIIKPALYNLFTGEYSEHRLKINVTKGFKLNSFTFG